MKTYDSQKSGNVIYVYNNDINRAIGKLRHKTSALMKEIKERRYHTPKSVKKRMAQKSAVARERARLRKESIYGF